MEPVHSASNLLDALRASAIPRRQQQRPLAQTDGSRAYVVGDRLERDTRIVQLVLHYERHRLAIGEAHDLIELVDSNATLSKPRLSQQ